ncbi:membrane protein implicated in regulation of membrane protease activity [Leptolyngbyaceae cyanobacterium JSC-12]|nr:membrane protein implicated in regulation of membrane protease activity [Leptolyngbyaceae cyanobacterium JSC-12]
MPLSPTGVWLLIGTVLCLSELLLPTAFVAFVMGVSAFAVAAIAGFTPLNLQILLWAGLSLALVVSSRRLVRTRESCKLDATEAETLTEIPPGKTGRVLYEGNSWAAQCEDPTCAIAPHQKVHIVSRRGTILIVIPENLLHS